MQFYRLLFVLVVAFVANTAAEDADPCLAEDYAEANCALAVLSPNHGLRMPSERCTPFPHIADGTCCANGGYKKDGHGYAPSTFSANALVLTSPPFFWLCTGIFAKWLAPR